MRSKTKVFVLFIVIILSTTAFRPIDKTLASSGTTLSWEKLIANLSDTFQVNRDKTFNWLQRKTNLAATQNDPGVDEPTHWEPNFNPPTTSLFQGGATYNYPILIPPGANGVQPNVGIGYNSSGTNRSVGKVQSNPEGWGWHLSGMIEISQEIKVCDHNSKDNPSQGCVKTYEDFYGNNNIRPTYHLSINGTGYELIHVNGRGMNGADGQYRAMGSNSLYVELCHGSDKCKTVDSGDSIVDGIVDHGCDFMKNDCPHVGGRYWLVITPDNTKYRLGYKAESEQKLKRQKFPLPDDQKEYYLDYNNPEFAVGPADNRASERKLIVPVLRWRVDLIQDKFNNQVIYSYEESDGDNTVFSELNYLKSISYTTDADHGVGYDVTIGFDYWANPDDDYNLPKGVVSYQTKELNEIEVLIDGEKLRSYDFVYVNSKYGDGYSFPDTKVAKQSDRCKLDSTQWNNGYMNGWHAKLLKSITEKDAYGNARVSGTPDVEFTYVFRQTGKVLTGTQINQVDPTQIDEKYFHWCRPYMKSAKLLYNGTTKRNLPSVSFNWSHWKDGEKYRDSYISREFIYSGLESSSSDKVDRDTPGFLNVYSHRDEPSITASKEGSDFPVLLGWSRVTKKTYDLAETTLYRTEETDFLALPTGHQEELLTGRPFEVRTFDGNGNQLSKSETIWAVLGEANEPKVMASRSTNYTDNQTNIGVVTANRYDPNEYYFQDRTFTWVNDKTKLGADLNTYKNLDNWNDSDPTVSQKQHLRITHNTAADTWLVGLPVRTINWAKADKDSALETVSNTLLRYDNHDCYKLNNQLGEVIPPTTGLLTAIDTFNVDESNRGLGNGICYDNYITTQFEYDGSNAAAWQRAKTIDPEGYETTYAWKDGIRLQSITTHDKLSDQTLTTSYAYDEDDTNVNVYTAHPWQVVEIKAPNATNPVRYTYDSFGRLEDTRSTSGKLIQRVTYRDEATPFELQVDTFPFANNLKVSSTSFYDGVGRVFATETTRNGTTSHQHTAFDVLSRPICQTTVNSGSLNTTNRCNSQTTTSTSYDDFKNIVTTTQPNGETVTQDTTGFTQTVTQNQTDSVTLTTISESDTYGRLSKVIEPTGAETTYAYNAGGFLTSVTDANTNVTTMGYDTLGRKLSMADPDMGSWTYEYDANGNLQKQSANNTDHLCFVYDGFNRLETKSECGSTSPLATYKYFETGQLERVEWQGMVGTDYEEFDYDPVNGLLISHAKKLGSAPLFVMKYADFSAADQPKKIEYPDGEIVSMTYDSYGVETLDAGADQLVTSMLHNIRGQMTAVNRGTNGSNTTYSYYGAGNLFRLEAIKHGAAQDQVPDYDYTYDYVGNIRTQTEQTTLGSQRQEFNYDTLNRLTSAKATTALGDAAAYTRSYSYDAIGNIQTMTIEGQTIAYKDSSDIDPSNPNQTLNPFEDGLNGSHPEHTLPHAVVRAGDQEFKYDQDGNMVYRKDKTGEYDQVFDIENRLISVTDKATNEETKFFYDASGQRTMTVETGENDEQIITYFPFPEYEEVHTTTQINQAPQWTQPPNQVTVVNTADSLQLEAIDPENDPLTFSATGLPPGLNIDSQSGLISGIPNQIQSYTVTATVIDGAGNSESVTFTWDVIESNDPPILEAINDQTNKVGEFVDLRLSGTDPDGDTITYRAEGLPAGLGLTQSNGQISGRPTAPGVFTVRAFANDGKVDSAPVTFTWTVTPNAVPMITNPGDLTHELNKEVTVQLIATDADGDALTYFAGNLPPGLAIDPVSGLISGIPTELGEFSVTFIVSDGFGGQDVESIKWTIIEPAPSCPVLENAGFEDGLNNWTLVNGATATVTSDAAEGSSAALINGGPNDANGGGWLGQDLDVVGDTTIEFTGSYKTGSYGFFQVGIDYYNDDAFIQSTLRNIDDSFTSFSTFSVSSVVPANANKAQVWMYASADDTLIVDDLFAQEVGCDGGPRSPRLTNPGDQSNTVNISIAPLTLAVSDPDSNQFTFSSTGLPTGLALNPNSGEFSGTPNTVGSYTVNVTVTDDQGLNDSETFSWSIVDAIQNQRPILTNPGSQNSPVDEGLTLQIAASDADGDSLTYSATGLPQGLTINAAAGNISGTPTQPDTYNVSVTVSDGEFAESVNFSWTVYAPEPTNRAPVISTNASNRFNTVGETASVQFNATDADGDSLTWSATNLPDGLNMSTSSGRITGQFTKRGTFNVTVTVSDGKGGTDQETFTWTVNGHPQINDPGNQSNRVGDSASLTLQVSDPDGDSVSMSVSGLPDGLNYNSNNRRISGTLANDGSWDVTVVATDGRGGRDEIEFTWSVGSNGVPNITNPGTQNSQQYASANLAIQASDPDGDSLTWSATGLPSGLDIDQDSGVISGQANGGGQYSVRVTVNDGRGGSDSETFSWIVNRKPTVNNPGNQTSRVCTSQSVSLQISASDPDGNGLSYSAPELPSGLSINGSGLITGKPTTAQNKTVSVSVSDGRGGIDSTSFSWTTIANTKPSITKPATQATARNQAANLQLSVSDANGDPVTVTVTGLPQGLTYNPSTRKISGTVSKSAAQQNYTVTISATDNCGGASTQTFTWQVVNTNPVWNPVPVNQSTAEGEDVNLTIKATDANGDTITYKATNLPQGLNLDPNTGQIRGRVLSSGNKTVTLEAVDGNQGKVEKTIFWTVTSPQKVGYVGQVSLSKSAYLEARNDITKNGWIKVTHNQNIGSDEVGQRPIVIAQPITKPDDNSAVALIRLRNVTSNSFEYNVHLQPGALKEDFPNSAVKFTYMVVKEGNWEFRTNNRQIIEIKAGLTTTQNGNHTVWTPNRCDESDTNLGNFKSVSFGFGNTFKSTPAIFTQIQTNNVAGFVTTRQRASSTSGFDVAMQEADYANNPSHNSETIGYVAMTTTQGGAGQKWDGTNFEVGRLNMRKQVAVSGWGAPWWQVVEFNNYYGSSASAMRFIGSLSTWNGKNHVHLRYKNHSTYGDSLLIKMEEDTTVPDRYDCNGDGIAEKENPDPNHEHIHDETMDYFAIYQNKVLEAFTKGTLDHSAASLDLDMVEVDAQSTQVGYSKSGGEISLATDPIEFGPQLAPERFQTQQTEQVQVTIRKNYLAGGTPIAQRTVEKIETTVTEDSLHFIYTDHLGNASTLINAATQEVDQSVRFYPFGEMWAGEEELGEITDRGFTGHRENRDVGLTYMNARFYVPSVGKFASADTIVPDPANPQTFNRYAYVMNNPMVMIDPSGHSGQVTFDPGDSGKVQAPIFIPFLTSEYVNQALLDWGIAEENMHLVGADSHMVGTIVVMGHIIHQAYEDGVINNEQYDWLNIWWANQKIDNFGNISQELNETGVLAAEEGQKGLIGWMSWFRGGPSTSRTIMNPCRNSFEAGTLISTPEGLVAIETLLVGDYVLAYNELTGQIGSYPVTKLISHIDYQIIYLKINGEVIITTSDHPFYTQEGAWINAGELEIGDEVRQLNWETGLVEAIYTFAQPQQMYNFTVATAHTYFVGDKQWLVHNSNCTRTTRAFNGRTYQGTQVNGRFYPDDVPLPGGRANHRNSGAHGYANQQAAMSAALGQTGPVVQISPGKWRSVNGRYQIRALSVDVKASNPHIHLEAINPNTGQISSNVHFYFGTGGSTP